MKKRKSAAAIDIIFNIFFIVLFLFALYIAIQSFFAALNKKQPSVFGYMVSQIKSSSMTKSGFNEGDYVVTKKIKDSSLLKAATETESGDIIVFYVHSNWKPVLDGDDRSDTLLLFHEIVGISKDGSFITKGSSNSKNDPYAIPFESISGVYVETSGFVNFILRLILSGNKFLYFATGVITILVLRQIFLLYPALKELRIQNEVMKGKRKLLDKKCFEKNIFQSFSKKNKNKLLAGSPCGMKLLYEYLLFGKINEQNDAETAKKISGKRCTVADVLCLTYASEMQSNIKAEEYVQTLPLRQKNLDKYRTPAGFEAEYFSERSSAFSLLAGSFLFTLLFFAISFISDYFAVAWKWEALIVGTLTPLALAYFLIVIIDGKHTRKRLIEYFIVSKDLPERYFFIMSPEDYTAEKMTSNALEIEKLMRPCQVEKTADKAKKDSLPQIISSETSDNVDTDDETNEEEQNPDKNSEENKWWDNMKPFVKFEILLRQSPQECKNKYSLILNEILAYRGVRQRISARFNTLRAGKTPLLRISMRNNVLMLYFNLEPAALQKKYYIKDKSEYKVYKDFPSLLKVRSNRSFGYALKLIDQLAEAYSLIPKMKYTPHDYAGDFHSRY